MKRPLLIALLGLMLIPVPASAQANAGRKLDAIQSGRLYDPVLTPQMNPSFQFQPNAEADFLRALRQGRVDTDRIPERQLDYFRFKLEQ
tara:strand:- start:6013 stop:6279 length:267 start_codon:yes stop_codon:yes gene_type:complete